MKRTLLLLGLLALSACGKKAPAPPASAATPTPAPAASAATPPGSTEAISPSTAPTEVGTASATAPVNVEAPAQVNLDPKEIENQRVKEEVLKRIDLMPDLTPQDKDKLYVQVDRARAMGKVITIPFPSGRIKLDSASADALGEKLGLEQVHKLTDDPTVVFVVLGFADKKGDPKQNQEISLARANAVMEVLENRFHLLNVMHAVGMGSSEMFDAQNFDKNRVVEVWAVLP
jgi:outer membrane protein OmpA-like peptidoglycan-associated protein